MPVEQAPAASPPPPIEVAPDDSGPLPSVATTRVIEPASNAAPPRKHSAVREPRTPREPAPTPQGSPPIPNKKLPSARCADIIQRVSLGEPLSDAEKAILKRECGP